MIESRRNMMAQTKSGIILPEGFVSHKYITSEYAPDNSVGQIELTGAIEFDEVEFDAQVVRLANRNTIMSCSEKGWSYTNVDIISEISLRVNGQTVDVPSIYDRHIYTAKASDFFIDGEKIANEGLLFTKPYIVCGGKYLDFYYNLCRLNFFGIRALKNGEVLKNLVPCTSNEGWSGMYDIINNVFHRGNTKKSFMGVD